MSSADEHASHMPPQGDVDAQPLPRLETLRETGENRVHTRSLSRKLREGEGASSGPTAAMSNVTSHRHPDGEDGRYNRRSRGSVSSLPGAQSILPQVLAWLRGEGSAGGEQDARAVNSLQKVLNERAAA